MSLAVLSMLFIFTIILNLQHYLVAAGKVHRLSYICGKGIFDNLEYIAIGIHPIHPYWQY